MPQILQDAFIGEIKMFGGSYAPLGWAMCAGQILPISQHNALFSLIGTTYGGDGITTFGLPDLRGRVPLGQGQGIGLTNRIMGQRFGYEHITLDIDQIPTHNHPMMASGNAGTTTDIYGALPAVAGSDIYNTSGTPSTYETTAVSTYGGLNGETQPHTNIQPRTSVNFIIAMFGVYPSRN